MSWTSLRVTLDIWKRKMIVFLSMCHVSVCANKWFKTEGQSYLWAAMHQSALDGQWSCANINPPSIKSIIFKRTRSWFFSNRYFWASFENVFFYKFGLKSFNFDSNYFISHDLCIRQKSRSANRIECFFTTWTTLKHSINAFKYILIIKKVSCKKVTKIVLHQYIVILTIPIDFSSY